MKFTNFLIKFLIILTYYGPIPSSADSEILKSLETSNSSTQIENKYDSNKNNDEIYKNVIESAIIVENMSKKVVNEFVVEYLKKINVKICTVITNVETDAGMNYELFRPFLEANIFVRRTNTINDVSISNFGVLEAFVIDMNSEMNIKFLEMASHRELFNGTFQWILTGQNLNETIINNCLNRFNIHVDSKITVVNLFDNNETKQGHQQVLFYDIWKPSHRHVGNVNINLLGYGIFSSSSSSSMMSKSKQPLIYFNEPDGVAASLSSTIQAPIRMRLRQNMSGANLRVMTVIQQKIHEPFQLYLKHTYNRHLDTMHRFNIALLDIFREMFNVTFHMKRTKSWGYPCNGTWDGMVGALIKDDIDIGGSSIFYYKERQAVVTGVGRSWIERPCFFFIQPYDPNAIKNIFLIPFSTNVWICILLCSFLFIFVMFFFYNFEDKVVEHKEMIEERNNALLFVGAKEFSVHKHVLKQIDRKKGRKMKEKTPNAWIYNEEKKRNEEQLGKNHSRTVTDSILQLLGAICQQGLQKSVGTSASRCFSIFVLAFGFLIYQFYSSSIVSALLMEKPKTIKTLRNLIDSPLELYIDNVIYMKNYFTRTTDPEHIELYNKKIVVFNKIIQQNELHYMSLDEGMELIKKGPYAFYVQDNMAYRLITDRFTEQQICDLTEIEMLKPQHMQLIVRKMSPFREILTYSVKRMYEHGFYRRETQFWKTPTPKCVRTIQTKDFQVRVEYIYSVLIFLTAGYITSFAILCAELLYAKYCNNNHHTHTHSHLHE